MEPWNNKENWTENARYTCTLHCTGFTVQVPEGPSNKSFPSFCLGFCWSLELDEKYVCFLYKYGCTPTLGFRGMLIGSNLFSFVSPPLLLFRPWRVQFPCLASPRYSFSSRYSFLSTSPCWVPRERNPTWVVRGWKRRKKDWKHSKLTRNCALEKLPLQAKQPSFVDKLSRPCAQERERSETNKRPSNQTTTTARQ